MYEPCAGGSLYAEVATSLTLVSCWLVAGLLSKLFADFLFIHVRLGETWRVDAPKFDQLTDAALRAAVTDSTQMLPIIYISKAITDEICRCRDGSGY